MIPFLWLNWSGNHKLAMWDSLTARRKSWHSQATWLVCISNIRSFICFSCLIIAYATITGVQDLGVINKGTKKKLKAWRNEPLLTNYMKWSIENSFVAAMSKPKTIENKLRHSNQIHKNYSGSPCFITTINQAPCSVLVFGFFFF